MVALFSIGSSALPSSKIPLSRIQIIFNHEPSCARQHFLILIWILASILDHNIFCTKLEIIFWCIPYQGTIDCQSKNPFENFKYCYVIIFSRDIFSNSPHWFVQDPSFAFFDLAFVLFWTSSRFLYFWPCDRFAICKSSCCIPLLSHYVIHHIWRIKLFTRKISSNFNRWRGT